MITENFPDRCCFILIIEGGGSAVGVNIVDIFNLQVCILHRSFHGTDTPLTARRGSSNMMSVSGGAVTADFAVDSCASCFRMFSLFKDQHTGAFAHHKPIPLLIKGTGRLFGVFVLSGECFHI